MDAFLARVSYHATSYAIRSCLALTSTLVLQQGSRLLKAVDDHPLRAELAALQRRLARKIELVSPILESIEFRYTRGNTALEAVVRVGRELRDEIDALTARYQDAAILEERLNASGKKPSAQERRAELLSILAETKQLMASIDDLIPSINLWVSAIGGVQTEQASFSPSRLLQASMVVNIGDTQFVLDPSRPMQIGPDFALSLYMLFRGHASAEDGEAYGVEEGQRKPMWQEVIHKSRVRLYRVPTLQDHGQISDLNGYRQPTGYAYQLQIVEDLDDGRVHTFEDGNVAPGPYDGVSLAGIREIVPVGQISKMFYADVGRILNVNNEDGASSNPVLLLKRDTSQIVHETQAAYSTAQDQILETHDHLLESVEEASYVSDSTLSESSPQDEIDRQLREESQAAERTDDLTQQPEVGSDDAPSKPPVAKNGLLWAIPHNLDPEWLAMEVFEIDDASSSSDGEDDDYDLHKGSTSEAPRVSRSHSALKTPIDGNLITQLQRMSIASKMDTASRPSSSLSHTHTNGQTDADLSASTELVRQPPVQPPTPLSPTTIERSPFGAIRTSLSLLEMLLRLTSLQEFEQTTHLSIPDHVLKFYLDESASESGLHGKERWAARAEAAKKMGFDPYVDRPEAAGSGQANI